MKTPRLYIFSTIKFFAVSMIFCRFLFVDRFLGRPNRSPNGLDSTKETISPDFAMMSISPDLVRNWKRESYNRYFQDVFCSRFKNAPFSRYSSAFPAKPYVKKTRGEREGRAFEESRYGLRTVALMLFKSVFRIQSSHFLHIDVPDTFAKILAAAMDTHF
jgi:hypothetical protein